MRMSAMGRSARAVMVLGGLTLGGCMTEGGGGTYYETRPSPNTRPSNSWSAPANDSPSIHNTSGGARDALKAGCRERYPTDDRKYKECINGDRHSEEALAVGCSKRYPGNGEKIRRCLSGN